MINVRIKKLGKIYRRFFLVSLAVCIIIGIFTKKSYIKDTDVNSLDKYSKSLIYTSKSYKSDYFINDINTFDQLDNESDYVLKVKSTKDRKYVNKALLTKCEVIKSYKKKIDKAYIYIYEPVDVSIKYELFISLWGYNFMKPENEYIVFLKDLKLPQGYKASHIEKLSFMYTNPEISKFNCGNEENTVLMNSEDIKDGKISYNEVKNFEQIFSSKEQQNKYREFKSIVNNKYR